MIRCCGKLRWWVDQTSRELVGYMWSHGVLLDRDKLIFPQNTVEFARFSILKDSVKIKYLTAIRDFPTRVNLTDLGAWFGLVYKLHMPSQ